MITKNTQKMEMLTSERIDITFLGMDWMRTFLLTNGRTPLVDREPEKAIVFKHLADLTKHNFSFRSTEVTTQIKRGYYPVKQKTRLISLSSQEDVEKALEKMMKTGHVEKTSNVEELSSFITDNHVKNEFFFKNCSKITKTEQ